jgi:hypothetical protein
VSSCGSHSMTGSGRWCLQGPSAASLKVPTATRTGPKTACPSRPSAWTRSCHASIPPVRKSPLEAQVFSDELGDPIDGFRKSWVLTVLWAHGVTTHGGRKRMETHHAGMPGGVPVHQSALARSPARVRLSTRRAARLVGIGARLAPPCVDRRDRAL